MELKVLFSCIWLFAAIEANKFQYTDPSVEYRNFMLYNVCPMLKLYERIDDSIQQKFNFRAQLRNAYVISTFGVQSRQLKQALKELETCKLDRRGGSSGNEPAPDCTELLLDLEDVSSPLIIATLSGQKDTVDSLLKKGAPVDKPGKDGKTAVWYAAYKARVEILRSLIDANADVDIKDNYGRSPLSVVGLWGKSDTSKIAEVVRLLVSNGAPTESPDSNGKTAIWWAAYDARAEAVEALIQAGANIHVYDRERRYPLEVVGWGSNADKSKVPEVFRLLLAKGSNIDDGDYQGRTPIWWAAYRGDVDLIKLLLKAKVFLNKKDHSGKSPLSVVGHWDKADQSKIAEAKALLKSAGAKI